MTPVQIRDLSERVEDAISASFPFIRRQSSSTPEKPFQTLRETFMKDTKGIFVSVGKHKFRNACHLVSAIRKISIEGRRYVEGKVAGHKETFWFGLE